MKRMLDRELVSEICAEEMWGDQLMRLALPLSPNFRRKISSTRHPSIKKPMNECIASCSMRGFQVRRWLKCANEGSPLCFFGKSICDRMLTDDEVHRVLSTVHPFAHQVAGHDPLLASTFNGHAIILKPSTRMEWQFYQRAQGSPLREWIPAYHSYFMTEYQRPYTLVIEDLTAEMSEVNVIDLKLGRVMWDSEAHAKKRRRMDMLAKQTMSGAFGVRVTGGRWTVHGQQRHFSKEEGKHMQSLEELSRVMHECCGSVMAAVHAEIDRLLPVLANTRVSLRSASLLILHDRRRVRVKLIDFAHSTVGLEDEAMASVVEGVRSLLLVIGGASGLNSI